jgi:hypothetical protein
MVMVNKKDVKKALSPPPSKKKPKLSQAEIKEQITGIKENTGPRNKQSRIQAEISGDLDNAISKDEVRPSDKGPRSKKKVSGKSRP